MMIKARALLVKHWIGYSWIERLLWLFLLVIFLIVVSWRLLWIPAVNALDAHTRAYQESQQAAEWLSRRLSFWVPDLAATAPSDAFEFNLTQWVSQSSQAYALEFNRFEPVGTDGLRIWLEQQDFEAISQWLKEVSTQGLMVRDLRISRGDSPGTADVVLLITQP